MSNESGFEVAIPDNQNMMMAVEQTRAVQEIQSALVIAKKFPRDEHAAYTRIIKSCERPILAQQAIYRLPIGGKIQEGPSIRLAEVMAQSWGNLSSGVKEERGNGRSKCIAFCWDQETNVRAEIHFEVEHWIEVGQKGSKSKKYITDPNEISRLIANHSSKKLRDCILKTIPGDVTDAAMKKCYDTQKKGDGKPLGDRIRDMVLSFSNVGVNIEMLEERLKHKTDLITVEEAVELSAIYNAIKDNQAKRGDFFNFPADDNMTQKESVIDKLKGNQSPTARNATQDSPPQPDTPKVSEADLVKQKLADQLKKSQEALDAKEDSAFDKAATGVFKPRTVTIP